MYNMAVKVQQVQVWFINIVTVLGKDSVNHDMLKPTKIELQRATVLP
jgi:hypothetical protein